MGFFMLHKDCRRRRRRWRQRHAEPRSPPSLSACSRASRSASRSAASWWRRSVSPPCSRAPRSAAAVASVVTAASRRQRAGYRRQRLAGGAVAAGHQPLVVLARPGASAACRCGPRRRTVDLERKVGTPQCPACARASCSLRSSRDARPVRDRLFIAARSRPARAAACARCSPRRQSRLPPRSAARPAARTRCGVPRSASTPR